jgi:NAD(P)-dependent dehydrogenase (short-subunit alcohol dehydrogenase family)
MNPNYIGKVVVITGASSGIGAALSKEIATRGGFVVLVGRNLERLTQVMAQCPGSTFIQADITNKSEVDGVCAEALARYGQIDIWVSNAGRGISRNLLDLSEEDVDEMIKDNVKSVVFGMQAVLPYFQEVGQGVLANVSSMLGRIPAAPARSAYSAAKAAVVSLTETARMEFESSLPEVRFVTVFPGAVATDFGNNSLGGGIDSRAIPNAQDVMEVAQVIADGLMSGPVDLYTRIHGAEAAIGHIKKLANI